MARTSTGVSHPAEYDEERVLAAIGTAVLVAQGAEDVLRLCMTFVVQKGDAPLTIETLEAQQSRERRKTIGYFVGELRKRATVRGDLDTLLSDFIEKRNTLIHRVHDVPGWDMRELEGRKVARSFADDLTVLSFEVAKIFVGFIRAWQEQRGIHTPLPSGTEDFFAEIDRRYVPLIDRVLSTKE